jgi:hypothetical protein
MSIGTTRNRSRGRATAAPSSYYNALAIPPTFGAADLVSNESTELVPLKRKPSSRYYSLTSKDDDDNGKGDDDRVFTDKNILICLLLGLCALIFGAIVVAILAGQHILPGTSSSNNVATSSSYGNTVVTFTSVSISSLSLCVTSNATTSVLNFTIVYPTGDVFNLTLFMDDFATETGVPLQNATACGDFTTDVFQNGVLVGSDPGVARRRRLLATGANITANLIIQVLAPVLPTPTTVALFLVAAKTSAPNITIPVLSVATISTSR